MNTSPRNLWYYVALVATTLATLAGGYLIGTSLERNDGEEKLTAYQRQATQAIATRDAAATLSAVGNQGYLETLQAQSTQAVAAVTQTVQGQQMGTAQADASLTAIATSATVTPSSTSPPTETPTPMVPQARLLSLTVAVRLGPGLEYPIIDYLPQDTRVELIGLSEDGAWVQISYGYEKKGFVPPESIRIDAGNMSAVPIAQDFPTLTLTPSPTFTPTWVPSPTHTITPTFEASPTPSTPEARVFAIIVPVYAGPDESYHIIGTISQDTPVQVVGISDDRLWLHIYTDTIRGFVRANTLTLTGGSLFDLAVISNFPTMTPAPDMSLGVDPQAVAAGQFVVVRAGPDYAFDTLGVVSANETLDLTGIATNGHWFQIRYAPATDGLGWVSGEAVRVSGDLRLLPAVEGPPLPTHSTSDSGFSTSGAAGNTSAGSLGPVDPIDQLPDNISIDYEGAGLDSYAYETVIAVNGSADGANYQSLLSVSYAQADGRASVELEATGAFRNALDSEDLGFLLEFLPLTIGTVGQQGYFYSAAEDICLDLGPDVAVQSITSELGRLARGRDMGFLDILPQDAVFGIIDRHPIAGIPSVHYQLIGRQRDGGIIAVDELKLDMWWTPDESVLLGYRFTVVVDSEFFFLYREALIEIDPAFADIGVFQGTITLYQLPRGVDAEAFELATPPSACDFIR